MKRFKISLITIIILLVMLIIATIILNQTGVIKRIADNINKEEIKKEISYEVYKHVDGKTAILVIVEDTENGIEKIIYPNNEMQLSCNGKIKVAFDYNTDITGKDSLTFKAINTKGEEIEKTILINDQFYRDLIGYNFETETETQKALTVNFKEGSITKQYRIGTTDNWTDYTNAVRLDDYQMLETLGNENRETNVYLRQIDNMGYEIVTKVKYNIGENTTYKQEDTVIEGESILDCVENNTLASGNYVFKVTGTVKEQNEEGEDVTKVETIEYPVELYNYDEDAVYIGQDYTVIENTAYTGMGKANSEKRMLVLKYNGNLTIEDTGIITPTGTSESINGATYLCTKKGMFIYCAGTLTNNGTISMTAKGTVNQEGENVYLYKNTDNSYEYIPAIGAIGGNAKYGNYVRPGLTGNYGKSGTERKTGGGGSGAANYTGSTRSGAGGNGTSYSGGSGGGGANGKTASTGSSTGGIGGTGTATNVINGVKGAGGGAGNPGGRGTYGNKGSTGIGGLMIIETDTINNNGSISANGSNGGYGYCAGGGGSGGGSINIFYKTNITRGQIIASGGAGGSHTEGDGRNGGKGGSGCITIGKTSTGTFVKDE